MGLSYDSWIQKTFTGYLCYADFSFLMLSKAEHHKLVLFCLLDSDYWFQSLSLLTGLCSCMRYHYLVCRGFFDGCYRSYRSRHSIQVKYGLWPIIFSQISVKMASSYWTVLWSHYSELVSCANRSKNSLPDTMFPGPSKVRHERTTTEIFIF